MKNLKSLLPAAIVLILSFSSCSKCYDCTYEVEIQSNGQTQTTTATDEFCTASADEVNERESKGQKCTAQ
jgi:outer membrane protein assembly factor BamE (lipoprotein component of BamABCDE complex)